MEVVVYEIEKPVVPPQGLTQIPSFHSVPQAISVLCKQTEVGVKRFLYGIRFPFGLMDYTGLKQLQSYHCNMELI